MARSSQASAALSRMRTRVTWREEVDVTEAVMVEILGRETAILPMVLGEHVLLGVTVLEELDLMVDCTRNQLVPYHMTFAQPDSFPSALHSTPYLLCRKWRIEMARPKAS